MVDELQELEKKQKKEEKEKRKRSRRRKRMVHIKSIAPKGGGLIAVCFITLLGFLSALLMPKYGILVCVAFLFFDLMFVLVLAD